MSFEYSNGQMTSLWRLAPPAVCAQALWWLVLVASPLAAADRRSELSALVTLSDEVLERVGSAESPDALDWLRHVDALGRRHRMAFQIGGVVSGSGLGVGVEHALWRDSDEAFGWQGLRTYKGYQELGLFYRRELEGSLPGRLRVELDHLDLPREPFYGLGGASSREHRTDFRLTETRVRSGLWLDVTGELGISAHGSFENVHTGAGTDDALPSPGEWFGALPGYRETFNYGGLGLAVVWDGRDRAGYARRGALLAGEVEQWFGLSENAPPYRRFAVELQHVLPLPGHDHRLAARARVDWLDHDDDSAQLPFYLSRGLGGSRDLRSFALNRFRGESLALATLEYRAAVLPGKLDAVLFWDTGGVYRDLGELSPSTFRHSFGAGIRVLRHDAVVLRFDVAHGIEGTRFILSFGGTF